jgi:hypothetical protein
MVSPCLMTQADLTLHIRECWSQYVRWAAVVSQIERHGANRTGRHRVNVAKYAVSSNFVLYILSH